MHKTSRLLRLDGLRGLLSLVVALNHSFLVVAIPYFANVWGQNYFQFFSLESKIQQILMILGNGGAAVSTFFVLSGFVLSQSFNNYAWSPKTYFVYLLKRISRLYPAYLFTISLIALFTSLGFQYRVFPHASSWYLWWMNFNLDWSEFFKNTIFVHITLGGVTWTLRVIFIVSLFIPLLYLLSQKLTKGINLALVVLLIYLSFNQLNINGFRDFRYIYMFYAGLILPKFSEYFTKISDGLSLLLVPVLSLSLFVVRYQTDEYIGGVFETICAFVLLGIIIYKPAFTLFSFLENKFFLYLGKISYSLYLVHFSVLYCIARIMFQFLPTINYENHYLLTHTILFLLSFLATIPISEFVNKYIENPPVVAVNNLLKKKGLL